MNAPKTTLDVAIALRQAAEDIVKPSFPRCYGELATDADNHDTNPNDPAAVAWCATGRVLHLLGFESTQDLLNRDLGLSKINAPKYGDEWGKRGKKSEPGSQDVPFAIQALWVPFDAKQTHEAAYRMRRIADAIEAAIPTLAAERELQRA